MALPAPGPLTRFGVFLLVGGLVLIFAALGYLQHLSVRNQQVVAAKTGDGIHPVAGASTSPTAFRAAATPAKVDATAVAKVTETINQALAVLRDPTNPNKKAALDALRAALADADPHVAIAAIRGFLAGGQDASTGLRFKLGDGHTLEEAPTMRTFLMDQLGTISLDAGTTDAADVARATLETKGSADEWAVAMRNLAWADPDGSKSFLAAKARELIEYSPWQSAPTGGYLEAFDVAAYAGDPSIISDLGPLSSTNSKAGRAALIALQRLSGMAPGQVAAYLNANPDALADAPLRRADYMGSVDLSQPTQLAQAETYLNRSDVSEAEKDKFLGRLGVPAGFVSDTLVTPETISQGSIYDHRALVNQTATNWLASGKFPTLQGALQQLVTTTAGTPGG